MNNIDFKNFHFYVINWFNRNGRMFPWRSTKNPYHVFVAEILLRRTKAETVVAPYMDLINLYPTPFYLSDADVSSLRNFFLSLGLFSRANQLISSAKIIVKNYGGEMPRKLDELAKLPGVGYYSSRAINCLAFDDLVTMIDESSGRLIRRLLKLPQKGPAYTDKKLIEITESLLPSKNIREFNLGLLDIAYYYCKHAETRCYECPLVKICSNPS